MSASKPYREERPWGEFTEFTRNSPSTVKLLVVRPGEALSLQTHMKRDEFWRILSGNGTVVIGSRHIPAKHGEEHSIPHGTAHRLEGGSEPLEVLEISTGEFDDDDIVRIEDKYGRSDTIV